MKRKIKQIVVLAGAACVLAAFGAYGFFTLQKLKQQLAHKEQRGSEIQAELAALRRQHEVLQTEQAVIQEEYERLRAEHARLTEEHRVLVTERDEFLRQVKKVGVSDDAFDDFAETMERINGKIEVVERGRQELIKRNLILQKEITELLSAKHEADDAYRALSREKTQTLEKLAWFREHDVAEITRDEHESLNQQSSVSKRKLDDARSEISRLLAMRDKLDRQRKQLIGTAQRVSGEYNSEVEKNKAIERKLQRAPAQFAELSRQNKVMGDRMAGMHYNLGVYYLQERQFSRALKEFRKAARIRPSDALTHFNIGYIYAEHIVDRKRAIEHFQKYLTYSQKDDKDRDWVRKYIATWQSWGGEEPMR